MIPKTNRKRGISKLCFRFCKKCDEKFIPETRTCFVCLKCRAQNNLNKKKDIAKKCAATKRKNGEYERKSKSMLNEGNPQWKGNKVGYGGVHIWVRARKPKPEFCEDCKKVPPRDLANISQKYKRDVNDYKWLCPKCHGLMDKGYKHQKFLKRKIKDDKIFCHKCKEFLPKEHFFKCKKNSFGYTSYCKRCCNAQTREIYWKNHEDSKQIKELRKRGYIVGKNRDGTIYSFDKEEFNKIISDLNNLPLSIKNIARKYNLPMFTLNRELKKINYERPANIIFNVYQNRLQCKRKGKQMASYKDGYYTQKHFCSNCGKLLRNSGRNKTGFCLKCFLKQKNSKK